MEMTSYARQDQTYEYSMMPIQKSNRSTCFFCLPQQIAAQFSQEKYGTKQKQEFLDCIQNITNEIRNQT
jgi:hypothetical protein